MFKSDDDMQNQFVKSLHNMKLSNVSNLPENVDRMEVSKIDQFKKQINSSSKLYSRKYARSEMMFRFVQQGQRLKDALNISSD